MVLPRVPQQNPTERRRQEVGQVLDATGDSFRVSYRIVVSGSGETQVEVNFPVWFIDRPAVSQGGELAEGQTLTAGNYPWYTATVAAWRTATFTGRVYYVGATLAVVCGGPATQRGVAHFHAEGRALQPAPPGVL